MKCEPEVLVRLPTVIIFDPPGSIATASRVINNRSVIGNYQDAAGLYHGFVQTEDGIITTFDLEGATNTYAGSIDEAGRITGFYSVGEILHGFVRTLRLPVCAP